MSVTKNEWAELFFAKESKSFIMAGIVKNSGVVFSDEGDPAEVNVLAHVGLLAEGDRVLCVVSTSGAVYVLGKVNNGS